MGGKKRSAAAAAADGTSTPTKTHSRRQAASPALKPRLVQYEMKFAENEIVVALSDKETAEDPKEKFWIGRLLDEVFLGDKNSDNVRIRWFEYETEEDKDEEQKDGENNKEAEGKEGGDKKDKDSDDDDDDDDEKEEDSKPAAKTGKTDSNATNSKSGEIVVLEEDQEDDSDDEDDDDDGFPEDPEPPDKTPIGSLICAVTSLMVRQKETTRVDEPTRWVVTPAVYEYAEKKLKQQLEDDYDSETDSQFGDAAVEKRMLKVYKLNHKYMKKQNKKSGKKGSKTGKFSDDDDSDDDDDDGKKKKSKKKKKGGKKKAAKNKKGLTPRPFVEPVPNPFTENKTGKLETFSGDIERTGKEVIRAVLSKDQKALKAAMAAHDKVPAPNSVVLSVGMPFTALMWAMVTENIPAVKLLLEDMKPAEPGQPAKPSRVYPQPCALPTLDTGKQTSRYANYNRAAINASRGGREGNNALLHDANGAAYRTAAITFGANVLPFFINKGMPELPGYCLMRDFDEIPARVLDVAEATYSRTYNMSETRAVDAMMKAGHMHMAHRFISKQVEHAFNNNAYNFLHVECLTDGTTATTADDRRQDDRTNDDTDDNTRSNKRRKKSKKPTKKKKTDEAREEEPPKELFSKPVLARSIIKKSQTELCFTPLNCACINPNTAYLDKLLQIAPEHADSLDQRGGSLLHYAAACQEPGPVEYLLTNYPQQSSRTTLDKSKEMPLHWAARAARPANVLALLKDQSEDEMKVLLTAKTSDGLAPLHYAAQTRRKQNLETVRVLLEAGADANIASSAARNKVSPVHIAARMGDLPVLQLLLEHKGNPSKGDKLGRSPLIHACQNGHAHIVAYLLGGEVGVDPEVPDSSDNRPIHYAAAYGWGECMQLLLAKDENKEEEEKPEPTGETDKDGDTEMKESGDAGETDKVGDKEMKESGDADKDGDTKEAIKELYASPPSFPSIANPDPKNSWKTTPLAVAIQKGRQSVASRLMELPGVDINFPDGESGKTLFLRLVEVFVSKTIASGQSKPFVFDESQEDADIDALTKEMPWALRKLLDRTDVDVSVCAPDTGYNVLHLLCSQQYPSGEHDRQRRAVTLAKLVLSRVTATADGKEKGKMDIDTRDKEGMTALLRASVAGNTTLLEFLINRGANVKAEIVDKQGKNICHHLLGQKVHKEECQKQLELVEKKAGSEAEYLRLLESPDNEGFTPVHLAMKLLCVGLGDDDFERGNELIKALCSRFETLVRTRVGPTKPFTDPAMLASIIAEDGKDSGGNAHSRHNRNSGRNHNNRGRTLHGADRVDPTKIRAALESIDGVVPLDCTDVGKTLLHFACQSSNPERIKEMLKWLLEIAPDNAKLEAKLTPAQYLVREKLRTGALNRSKRLANAKEERIASMLLLLDCVASLLGAAGGDSSINDLPSLSGAGASKPSDKSYSAEQDKEAVGDVKRLAAAFQATPDDPDVGKELVATFHKLMKAREGRSTSVARSLPTLAVLLVGAGANTVPLQVWDRLVDEFKLELDAPTEEDTALLVALRKKDRTLCDYLCSRCPALLRMPNPKKKEWPVHAVAEMDNPSYVKMILDHIKSDLAAVNQRDKMGRTALHLSVAKAARRRGEALDPCELLFLRAGARVDAKDARQRTPLHYCFLDDSGGDDHFNFPHSLPKTSHDRIDLVSTLLGAIAAIQPHDDGNVKAVVDQPDRHGRTALFYAAAFNSTVSSLLLCNNGADLFHEDKDKNTPVNVAVLRDHSNFCITLLKSVGAASNLPNLVDVVNVQRQKTTNQKGKSAIKVVLRDKHSIVWHAIKKNFNGLVYILLDSFPLSQAVVDAIDNGSFQLVRKLLSDSPPHVVQYVNPDSGRSLLHEVANVRHYQNPDWGLTLANLLLESGVVASAVTKEGETSLHISATRGHVKLTELLSSKDASAVIVRDTQGHYPLGSYMRVLPQLGMSSANCSKMVDYLTLGLENLEDPEMNKVPRSKHDSTSIKYDGMSFRAGPNLDTVKEELFKGKQGLAGKASADCSDEKHFSTLIVQAIKSNQLGLAQKLINRGARIDLLDSDGLAPLHHAVFGLSESAVQLLLRNKSNPNVTTGDTRGLTPLMIATFAQSGEHANGSGYERAFEIAKMLLRFGALTLPACQQTGNTALHFAIRENNCRLMKLLLRATLYPQPSTDMNTGMEVEKGRFLVRFGCEAALHPAEISDNIVKVLGSEYPRHLISECFDYGSLALDSLEGLVKLVREKKSNEEKTSKKGSNGAKSSTDTATKASDGDAAVEASDNDEPYGEQSFGDDDSDDVIPVPTKPTGGGKFLRPTGGGKFLRPPPPDSDDSDDDDDDLFGDSDSSDDGVAGSTNKGADKDSEIKGELAKYYGLESLVAGTTDENLTSALLVGSSVIVQPKETKTYASAKSMWLEGRVAAAHQNGSYDIDLVRGATIKGVVRQQIRPWKTLTIDASATEAVSELLAVRDKSGFTCLQAAVKPFEFGSFESDELVDLLIDSGAAVEAETIALARSGSPFRAHLISKMKDSSSVMDEDEPVVEEKEPAALHGLEPIPHDTFEEEAKAALISLESQGMMKRKDASPKINKVCQMKAVGLHVLPVVKDAAAGGDEASADVPNKRPKFYDVVMVAVEMSHYSYSENKYYKMQVLRDPNKDLYVLLTNWGQVGDHGGQKQETPMGNREEAIKEFEKVFKSKTGNLFEDCGTEKFQPVLGKYKPISLLSADYEKPEVPDIAGMVAQPKDYPDVVRESSLPEPLIETISKLVDPAEIASAASSLGFHQDSLPLGRLSIETILEAEKKLDAVEAALDDTKKFTKPEQLGDRREALEKVAILSSQYFEMIPTREGDHALRPLDHRALKEQRTTLFSLKDLTVTSQIVNTASVHATKENPLDYAYRALNTNLDILPQSSLRTGIEQYFRNTCGDGDLVINEVFAVDRMDEPSNARMGNHRLLWHGTSVANVVGILKEGLRVAPQTAQVTGAAFGEGVYFADMASKSFGYCRANFQSNAKSKPRAYLLLADVALGEQERVTASVYDTGKEIEKGDTVMAVGYEGPRTEQDVTFVSKGAIIPLGKSMKNPKFKPRAKWVIKGRYAHNRKELSEEISLAIEKARNSFETKFPTSVRMEYESQPFRVKLDHGPYTTNALAVPVVKKRKKEQDGGAHKKQKGENGEKVEGVWHYWLDASMDGKQRGWHLYESSASRKLEGFLQNKGKQLSRTTWHLQSGYFSYEVDIENMTQRNMKTGTTRPIRRVLPGEAVTMTEPPIYVPPKNSGTTNQGDVAAKGLFEDSDDSDEEEKKENEKKKAEPKPMDLLRQEGDLRSCVHYNEYIVKDTNRINIKYIVEVTSKAWLKRHLKEDKVVGKSGNGGGDKPETEEEEEAEGGGANNEAKEQRVTPKEGDMVIVSRGDDAGLRGELVCIDGDDGIIKDANEDFKIIDMSCLDKIVDESG